MVLLECALENFRHHCLWVHYRQGVHKDLRGAQGANPIKAIRSDEVPPSLLEYKLFRLGELRRVRRSSERAQAENRSARRKFSAHGSKTKKDPQIVGEY